MPNDKSIKIQSMSLTPPFAITETFISMNELKEYIDQNINDAFSILSKPEEGALSYEYFDDGVQTVIRIQKLSKGNFACWNVARDDIKILDETKTLALIYSHMPFVSIIGTDRGVDILKELAKRKPEK